MAPAALVVSLGGLLSRIIMLRLGRTLLGLLDLGKRTGFAAVADNARMVPVRTSLGPAEWDSVLEREPSSLVGGARRGRVNRNLDV
jgi:hypothetical protein